MCTLILKDLEIPGKLEVTIGEIKESEDLDENIFKDMFSLPPNEDDVENLD